MASMALRCKRVLPAFNDTKIAFHYANYHSRLPYIAGFSASQEALQNSASNTAFNIGNGLLAPAQAIEYAFANITKDLELVFEYPEDIELYGLSFNTTTIRTGTAFSGEIAHHRDHPFLVHVGQVVPALLDLTPPDHPGFPDGDYSPPYASDSFVRSWISLDKTQLALGVTQAVRPQVGGVPGSHQPRDRVVAYPRYAGQERVSPANARRGPAAIRPPRICSQTKTHGATGLPAS